ncbi:MAG TPA: hypothetical protein VGZ72_09000 [Stellaceae bacterium]|jgi:hypothetical protein|nr:hypothetical protein [Stellaceae bacterium]
MSSLGPDGGFRERDDASGDVASASPSPPGASGGNDAPASLWAAFRDRYTRAKERSQLNEAGEWVAPDEELACPIPLHPWECRGA